MRRRRQQALASGLLLLGAAAAGLELAVAASAGHMATDSSNVIADPGQVAQAGVWSLCSHACVCVVRTSQNRGDSIVARMPCRTVCM